MHPQSLKKVWAGDPHEAPAGWKCVIRHAAPGPLVADEQIHAVAIIVLTAVARRLCTRSPDWRHPCPSCSLALLALAERCGGHSTWSTPELNLAEDVRLANDVLSHASATYRCLAVPAVDPYEPPWSIDYLSAEMGDDFYLTLGQGHRAIDYLHEDARAHQDRRVASRDSGDAATRGGVTRAEIEIASCTDSRR